MRGNRKHIFEPRIQPLLQHRTGRIWTMNKDNAGNAPALEIRYCLSTFLRLQVKPGNLKRKLFLHVAFGWVFVIAVFCAAVHLLGRNPAVESGAANSINVYSSFYILTIMMFALAAGLGLCVYLLRKVSEMERATWDYINELESAPPVHTGEDLEVPDTLDIQTSKMRAIGQLAAGIAHEINTPTQFIGDNTRFLEDAFSDVQKLLDGYASLADAGRDLAQLEDFVSQVDKIRHEVDLEYLTCEIPKAIEQSLSGLERVSRIVRAMKEFSHPGQDDKTLVDLNDAINSTITVARNEWRYVADVKTDFDSSLPLVPCHVGDFNQVMLNLIVNAAHAITDVVGKTPENKGTINICTKLVDDKVEITISDTGKGIPQDELPQVFDPFFTTKEFGKGSGQGLALARAIIVQKHNGSIIVESEPGKGATFIIRLPLEINKEAQTPNETHDIELSSVNE